jgi:opacity protein-like surface antigen
MTITMKHELNTVMAAARRALGLVAGALMTATAAHAQNAQDTQGTWRIGASTGGYVPFSSLIIASDTRDTQLEAGPAFSLDAQYLMSRSLSIYANGMLAFGAIRLGSSIQPASVGPSSQVMLTTGTAGLFLSSPDLLGEHLQPTLRLGGGFKYYSLDLTGAESQLRPTADVGVGLRGIGIGRIDVTAEVRYLLSSFDQSKLPTRGITPQDQRQNDLVFSIGFGIRP